MGRTWLAIIRMKKGLTQIELAERLHVSNRTISNIERGHKNPSGRLAYEIANELEFDVALFYQQEDSA